MPHPTRVLTPSASGAGIADLGPAVPEVAHPRQVRPALRVERGADEVAGEPGVADAAGGGAYRPLWTPVSIVLTFHLGLAAFASSVSAHTTLQVPFTASARPPAGVR